MADHHKTEKPTIETGQLSCRRCGRLFEGFHLEEIAGLVQLRAGSALVMHTELVCLHCGSVFYWNIREKDLPKMITVYGELLKRLKAYSPEKSGA